jgi:hypothetical protein
MPTGTGIAWLADVPDREPGHGPPQLVIRRKHPVIAMPVLPRRRDDVIGAVGGSLGHMAAITGRADAAALAGEGHDESRAARRADRAGEAEAENAASEIGAEFTLDISRHGPLPGQTRRPFRPRLVIVRTA